MTYCKIQAATTVTALDLKSLKALWHMYAPTGLVGTFRCDAVLTEAQRRRLPRGLRERLAD